MSLMILIITFIILVQVTVRILYSFRLFPEADYCMNSQYDVVLNMGGKAGRDFELSWGGKLISYLACRTARRLLPFGIYSPRIALAFVHGMATIIIFLTTFLYSNHYLSAVIAACVYAVTSSLIHTGTYVCSPENFDVVMLPLLALCLMYPSGSATVFAGAVIAFMTAWSKIINAFYVLPALLLYRVNGHGDLSLFFLISFSLFLLFTMVHYRFSSYYHPFFEIFINAYRYATHTQDRSTREKMYVNWPALRQLWKSLLREIPAILFTLFVSPFYLWQSASGRVLVVLGWSAVIVMILQNKLWPVHFFPTLSMASIVSGTLCENVGMAHVVLILSAVSVYFFFKPLFMPPERVSKYFWLEGSGALHYLDDEASFLAAQWIRIHAPDTRRVFCWGMQTQLYTLLEQIGPTPIQHFSKETLTIKERQEQLTAWFSQCPPEFIFFSDPYFRYYPLFLLEGLAGKEYRLASIFGEGAFPLYQLTEREAPDWKKRAGRKIGFNYRWNDLADVLYRGNPLKQGRTDGVIKEMKNSGIDSVFIYGSNHETKLLAALESNNIQTLGIVQTRPPAGNGIMAVNDVPWPVGPGTGFLITATSYNSIAQIREILDRYQPSARVFSVLDETPVSDWISKKAGDRGLIVYGLGTAGGYILSTARQHDIRNIAYYDRKSKVDSHPFVDLDEIGRSRETIFLGATPSTNISIYFSLLAKGVADSRITDFSAIFGRSCLPGRLEGHVLTTSDERRKGLTG